MNKKLLLQPLGNLGMHETVPHPSATQELEDNPATSLDRMRSSARLPFSWKLLPLLLEEDFNSMLQKTM